MTIHNTYEERSTKIMLEKPITPLARLIGRKWFLTIEELAERAGVSVHTLSRVLQGERIGAETERKLTAFLESYKGEETIKRGFTNDY